MPIRDRANAYPDRGVAPRRIGGAGMLAGVLRGRVPCPPPHYICSHRATTALSRSATEPQHRSHPYQRPAAADSPKWPRHKTEKTGKCIDKDIFQDLKSPTLPNSCAKALLNSPAFSSAECDDSEWTVGSGNPYSI